MDSSDTNPIAKITNRLEYDVDIYDVYNPNADNKTQGPLTYTKLATVPKGASGQEVKTSHFASQLQAMRTGNITALNNDYYLQFPVAVLPVSPFATSNAFDLTSDMQQHMESSFKFIKYTQANPASQLATNFRTALVDKTSQRDAVNKYFGDTASFKQCTLTTWTAVLSWQTQFTNPWQGTYYLYSLGSSSADSTKGSSDPALVATLAIVASAQADSAVLTMAGTNGENTSVVMGGDGKIQEKDQGTGNLSVVLTPTWLNTIQTGKQDDKAVTKYVIGAAFTGTINGQQVAGNLNQLVTPAKSDTSNKAKPDASNNAKDKSTSNVFGVISSIAGLVATLASIGMLATMVMTYRRAATQRQNDAQSGARDRADAQEREDRIEADHQEIEVPQQRRESVRLESSIVPQVRDRYRGLRQSIEIQSRQVTVQRQINQLRDGMELSAPSDGVEKVAEGLADVRSVLEKAADPAMSADERDVSLRDTRDKLIKTDKDVEAELMKESNNLSQQEERALSNTRDALRREQRQADAIKESEKKQEEKIENDQEKEVDDENFEKAEPEDVVEVDPVMEPRVE